MYVTSDDINGWASTRSSQDQLPKLVRRLIHVTANKVVKLSFPSGSSVNFQGWDGYLEVSETTTYVPEYVSVWEFSSSSRIRDKANSDYRKRTDAPGAINPAETTFIFVTSRKWADKKDWIARKKEENVWLDIRVYDADDLESWLELAPSVSIWFSTLIGKRPQGVIDLENYWYDFSSLCSPPIPSNFLLAGRDEIVNKISDWLNEDELTFTLQTDSRKESVVLFSSIIMYLPEELRVKYFNKIIIIKDEESWYSLCTSEIKTILIPMFENHSIIQSASRNHHRVLLPLGKPDTPGPTTHKVNKIDRSKAIDILSKIKPLEQSKSLVRLAQRSFPAFIRAIADVPESQQPDWSLPIHAQGLLPAMVVGVWNDLLEGDQNIVSKLSGMSYEQYSELLIRWTNESDSPIRTIGNYWVVISKEDMWIQLNRFLSRHFLEKFQGVVLEVFGTYSPKYTLPINQRWMAGAIGPPNVFSEQIMGGLADTLAAFGAYGDLQIPLLKDNLGNLTDQIVSTLLKNAFTDWRILATISTNLTLLAEASPESVISSLELAISEDSTLLLDMFSDSSDSIFSSNSPHTGILFALEALAWNPIYLHRVSGILIALSKIDPGGNLSNRPFNSLKSIFNLVLPQTNATKIQRLNVLDSIFYQDPEIAWDLFRDLLPTHTAMIIKSPLSWRDWIPTVHPTSSYSEVQESITHILELMIKNVSSNGNRWSDLLGVLGDLSDDNYHMITKSLDSINPDLFTEKNRVTIWNKLRSILSRHRSFSSSSWAMNDSRLENIEELYFKLAPSDTLSAIAWMFDDRPPILEGLQTNQEQYKQKLVEYRNNAIKDLYENNEFNLINELINVVNNPFELGFTIGSSNFFDDNEDQILDRYLDASKAAQRFSYGYMIGLIQCKNREYVNNKINSENINWTLNKQITFLLSLPFDSQTWVIAQTLGIEVEQLFWEKVPALRLSERNQYQQSARKLLSVGRPYSALEQIAIYKKREEPIPSELIIEALEKCLSINIKDDPPFSSFSYHISDLISNLEISERVPPSRIASIEWAFFSILEQNGHQPSVLYSTLEKDPHFFLSMIELIVSTEEEKGNDLQSVESLRRLRAVQVLDKWRTIPGVLDTGEINSDVLDDWIDTVHTSSIEKGIWKNTSHFIGQMLSYSPPNQEGQWPHPIVCNIIEKYSSIDLEAGFLNGIYNNRGVITKSPTEGGEKEYTLSRKYEDIAVLLGDIYPRTADMLRKLSKTYKSIGIHEDYDAEMRDFYF